MESGSPLHPIVISSGDIVALQLWPAAVNNKALGVYHMQVNSTAGRLVYFVVPIESSRVESDVFETSFSGLHHCSKKPKLFLLIE